MTSTHSQWGNHSWALTQPDLFNLIPGSCLPLGTLGCPGLLISSGNFVPRLFSIGTRGQSWWGGERAHPVERSHSSELTCQEHRILVPSGGQILGFFVNPCGNLEALSSWIVWLSVVSFPYENLPKIETLGSVLFHLLLLTSHYPTQRRGLRAKLLCCGKPSEWIPSPSFPPHPQADPEIIWLLCLPVGISKLCLTLKPTVGRISVKNLCSGFLIRILRSYI